MNEELEQLYQSIGQAAISSIVGQPRKILIYAEIDDIKSSVDLFFDDGSEVIQFRLANDTLFDLVEEFWDKWKNEPHNSKWRAMSYIIENQKFKIDFKYPDQVNDEEDVSDRTPLEVKAQFGDMPVDYSKPEG